MRMLKLAAYLLLAGFVLLAAAPAQAQTDPLTSWNDGPVKKSITDFIARATAPDGIPVSERIAVFDNDGTLWCEKPMPVELGFILGRMAEQAAQDPSLREKQPWKAAAEKDYKWLGEVITRHYQGDDTDVKVLLGGVLRAFAGMTVDEYQAEASGYFDKVPHPTLGRPFTRCSYAPMVELLRYLAAHRNEVVSREQLLRDVWGYHQLSVTRTVDNYIAKLRTELEPKPHEPRYIITVHGSGYQLLL